MSEAAAHHDHHDHHPSGMMRWVTTTNHKDIGTMYLVFALIMFFIGGAMAMIIRLELFQPGMQFVEPQFFNSMTTMHALVMIFGVVMPAWTGLANWLIPIMIGAPDMALPRLNNWSFWILPFAFTLLLCTLFLPGGAPAGGWTMYPPLVLQTGAAFPFLIFAVHFMGVSSVAGAINIIATTFNMRAGHELNEAAAVRVDLDHHGLSSDRVDARAGRRGDDAVDGQVLRYGVFQRSGRRRSGHVPAHFLVLRPS